jgi:hypothetical protein
LSDMWDMGSYWAITILWIVCELGNNEFEGLALVFSQ